MDTLSFASCGLFGPYELWLELGLLVLLGKIRLLEELFFSFEELADVRRFVVEVLLVVFYFYSI